MMLLLPDPSLLVVASPYVVEVVLTLALHV